MEGKLAVCINAFNAEETIEAVLESLIKQTYKEFYVFLIDNGSTDKTLSLCDDFIKAITFAGVSWPDIYVFKGEINKLGLVDFLERVCEIIRKVNVEITNLYFIQQDRSLEVNEVEQEWIKFNSL